MVAATINDINLLAGLPTTKVYFFGFEGEKISYERKLFVVAKMKFVK
jgi:hypothetical protein